MKILGPVLAAAVAALGAFAVSYASQPAGSPVATLALGAFLAVFVLGVALAAVADCADRRRERRRSR